MKDFVLDTRGAFVPGVFFAFTSSVFVFSLLAFTQSAIAQDVGVSAARAGVQNTVRPLEVHVANNGLVLLRSARVVAIQGTTLTLSTAWGSADLVWIVRVDTSQFGTHNFGTRVLDRDGVTAPLSDIRVGGRVTVTGKLDSAAEEPTVAADSVRSL